MSEKLVKRLEAEGQRIVARVSETIDSYTAEAVQRMEAEVKNVIDALKIQPLKGAADVVELLEKGGIIVSKKIDANEHDTLDLSHNNWSLIRDVFPSGRLKKGTYKVLLIVEPVEE